MSKHTPPVSKPLNCLASFNLIPIGSQISISVWVAKCVDILQSRELKVEVNALGTEIEGDISEILAAVAECHESMHIAGLPRIMTNLTLSTRTDRAQSLEEKRRAVISKLHQTNAATGG